MLSYVKSIDIKRRPAPDVEARLVELFKEHDLYYVWIYAEPQLMILGNSGTTWDSVDPKFKTMLALLL
jgi:hypothetical protein